jgi:hypothetical protein
MQKILVDSNQFIEQDLVQVFDDLGVSLHNVLQILMQNAKDTLLYVDFA